LKLWLYHVSINAFPQIFFVYLFFARLYRLVGSGTKLVGSGSATPKTVVSNDDLSKLVDTNDEWISVRTGIRNRRILSGEDFIVTKYNKNLIFILGAF
jgi:hypothetical protein